MIHFTFSKDPHEWNAEACFVLSHHWPGEHDQVTLGFEPYIRKNKPVWWDNYIEFLLDDLGMGRYTVETPHEIIHDQEMTFEFESVPLPAIVAIWNFLRIFNPHDYPRTQKTMGLLEEQFPEMDLLTKYILCHYVTGERAGEKVLWKEFQATNHVNFQRWASILQIYNLSSIHERISALRPASESPSYAGNLWVALGSPPVGSYASIKEFFGLLDHPLEKVILEFDQKATHLESFAYPQYKALMEWS